jgi:ABC-type sugar transport system ATPase subunit
MAEHSPILKMHGISKRFPGVQALNNVSFDVQPGEVHALIGENGAGKSTLMKILAGVYDADEGQIMLRGEPVHFTSPYDAWTRGISTIHQELMLIPQLTVAENIFLGKAPRSRLGFIDKTRMFDEAEVLLERLEIQADPGTLVGDLPVGLQQMVEIAKALSFDADLIVMDEPTSALSHHEIEVLFDRIERLRADGRSVVFISHKLDEVFRLSDRVTVLRDGEHIGTEPTDTLSSADLIHMMVGRDLKSFFAKSHSEIGEPILEVDSLTIDGQFYDVSFTLHAGEILGIAGLVGAGRTDVVRAIFGAERVEAGHVRLNGKELPLGVPLKAIQAGIGLVPENRKEQALFLQMDVSENIVIADTAGLAQYGLLKLHKERTISAGYVDRLTIRTPSLKQQVGNLSGGNQQKVILARWLAIQPQVLIVDEPTRGIDVGAKAEIHALLSELAATGVGIILISSEMEEVLSISDRVLVMRDGLMVAEFDSSEATQERIAAHAIGVKSD